MYAKLCPECMLFNGEAREMTLSRLDYEQHVVEVEFMDEFGYSHGFGTSPLLIQVEIYACPEGHMYKDVRKTGHVKHIATHNPMRDEL